MTLYDVQVLYIGHFSDECCWGIPWLRSARILWSWALACSTKSEEEVELFSTTNLRFILKLSLSVISRQDLYRQNNVILWYQHIKIEAPMAVNLSMYVSTVHWTLFSAHYPLDSVQSIRSFTLLLETWLISLEFLSRLGQIMYEIKDWNSSTITSDWCWGNLVTITYYSTSSGYWD